MKHFRVLLLLAYPFPALTADPAPAPAAEDQVQAWIDQLADPKVRRRDEAQTALDNLAEAETALVKAAASHPSPEARLRAQRLLKTFRQSIWTLETERLVTTQQGSPTTLRGLAVSPDGRQLVAMHRGGAELIETGTGATLKVLGNPCLTSGGVNGIQRAIAISPDGKQIASTDHTGAVFIDDPEGNRLQVLPGEPVRQMVSFQQTTPQGGTTISQKEMQVPPQVWALAFIPDTKNLLVYSTAGLTQHDLEDKTKQIVSLRELFPGPDDRVAPRCFAISPDGGWVAMGAEVMGRKDEVVLVRVGDLSLQRRWELPAIPASLAVPDGGHEVLIGLRSGGVHRANRDSGNCEPLHAMGGRITGLKYALDGKSAFLTTTVKETPLRQIALPSGETLWTAPGAVQGCEDVVLAGAGRIAVTTGNSHLQIWRPRAGAPTPIIR